MAAGPAAAPDTPAAANLDGAPRLWPLAWPLFVEMGLGIGVGVACTALAARAGDASAAAFALVQYLTALLFIFFRVIGAGIAAVLAQNLGAGRREMADATARATLGAATWIGLVCALAALALAQPMLAAMNAPVELLPLAVPLLQALAPALLLDAWFLAMGAVMRAHLRSREALAVVALTTTLQGLAALLLMPWLGLVGFAVALLISRVLGVVLYLGLWRHRLGIRPRWPDLWRLPRREIGALLHIGLPGALENIGYRLAFTASVAVVGGMGGAALATHAYATQLSYAGLLFGVAVGFSAEILVAHLVGAARLHDARTLVRRWLARGLVTSVAASAAMALLAPWLLRGFTGDAAIAGAAATLLWWTVLLEPGRTFNLVLVNALRAAGDARFPVAAGAGSMALVLAGGSWLLGHQLGLGLVGVWIAYAADEWLRGLMMWWRWRSLAWVPHARVSRRRLARR